MFEIFAWIGGIVAFVALLAAHNDLSRQHERRQAALKGWATRRARQAASRG